MYPSAVFIAPPWCPVHFGHLEDTAKGDQASFGHAAPGDQAEPLYERFCEELRALAFLQTGVFAARMQVELVNDGPVTVIFDA